MKITVTTTPAAKIESEALITCAFEKDNHIEGLLLELNKATAGCLTTLSEAGELTGKPLEFTLIHSTPGLAAKRLLIVGAGKQDKFSLADLRRLSGAALRFLKARGLKKISFLARETDRSPEAARAVVEGAILANFESDKYKTDQKNKKFIESLTLSGFDASPALDAAISRATISAESANFTRELVNEPSNKLTPRILADRAAAMAREAGLTIDVLEEGKIAALKMGALLSVSQGSVEPPRVIVLTYTPPKAKPGAPVLGLVGKAVTFDTGGISIKPAEGMEKMKYDMAGGATMIGVMRALAALKPSSKIIAVIPATENMPGSKAQKPGDVQFAMSGKSIEVLNTDAEGRLILADGVTYARQLGATHLIDAATLTGAIVVALANVNIGVFTNNQPFTDRLLASARAEGEKMWQMPMDDEYREFIKSPTADIQNIGSGKGGGAITGAMFIREFAEDTPWIHLDIAGTAWLDDAKPWAAKGASGTAVRSLIDFALKF